MTGFDPMRPAWYLVPEYHPAEEARAVLDPGTLLEVGQRAICGSGETESALAAVTAAQRNWARFDSRSRAAALHGIAAHIEQDDLTEVARLMTLEMGKPYPEAVGELANCASIFRYYAELSRDDAGKIAGTTQAGSFQYVRYEPLGVSAHIMPFNFPVLLMCWTVAASLAAGNGCVVKPAEATTLSTLRFMNVFRDLPPGLLSCLPGGPNLGRALVESPNTHAIAFTGSAATGKAVASAAGARLKPAIIEAGGSDALIVTEHAPLDVAAAGAVTAAFHMSGQVCTSAERLFVHEKVFDAFLERFTAETRRLRIGHGLETAEIGPLVSEAARAKVIRLVEDALGKGATLHCGGRIPPDRETGWFYEPTILSDCTPDMALLKEECFGPVASITKVGSLDEAIERANASEFGLGASLFTTSLEEAMEAADRIEAGMVWVNNPLIDNDALPFSGWKNSGMGRELSRQGLDAFRRSKMVILDHKPVRQDWWYPYPDDWFYGSGGRGTE
ncbi:aldehyde dehydrogenase family protein [Ovoidimarina sediminis]|uniref:aldehyde dehydrogenase family protein n=1 Tax=Ovoidimarina sediminis TaxID=3079856 RepID=UPI002907D2AE|nr:aldehyde dehydrogenase family protein [Rhodophyticola sp. MJ-SS7]MDU8945264.1 aldehyde dehydrogenase family protein [Rhodophyticola sp. MJ-SS7]